MLLILKFRITIIFILLFILSSYFSPAQINKVSEENLTREIVSMDSLLFDIGFNNCDFELWNTIFGEEFEFYDDRSGLNTDRSKEVMSFKERCAKKMKITRKLISTEVHPLNGYGAVQLGVHAFYVDGVLVQTAKFIHLWQKIKDKWIVSRIVSYDHKPAE
jgi:hypothetical protein